MNDFQGLLSGDYGFKPQGKSAPMAPPRSNPSAGNPAFDFDLGGGSSTTAVKKAPYANSSAPSVSLDDHDDLFSRSSNSVRSRRNNESGSLGGLDDVFGGSSKSTADSSVNLDSVFGGQGDSGSRFSSLPVFDKPVYDDEDDVFVGVSGLKSSSSAKYEDIFSSTSSPPSKKHDAFDDLLGGLGRKEPASKGLGGSERKNDKDIPAFDDLLPGFGASTVPSDRDPLESSWSKNSTSKGETKPTSYVEDPFVVLNSTSSDVPSSPGLYSDPLEQFTKLGGSGSKKYEDASATAGLFEDIDTLDSLGKPIPVNNREKVGSPARAGTTANSRQTSASVEARDGSSSARSPERDPEKKIRAEDYHEPPSFETYSASADSPRGAADTYSSPYVNASDETTSQRHTSTLYDNNLDSSDDVWLTVSEIPLFTQPTAAPPPSRPPPPKPARISKARAGSYAPPYEKRKMDNVSSFPNPAQSFQNPKSAPAGEKSSFASPIDEFEDFAKGRSWDDPDGNIDVQSGDNFERHTDAAASAAAMKEAMERAEARFKHAKGVRERETARAARVHQEREDKTVSDFQERELRERQERQQQERQLREEEERKQREEEERVQREREEREREQRRLERERIERERVRQAVERATREARDRAAADARARAEKAAVGKVQAEARERAERAAVMKAQAEARERAARAAAEAKQRADKEKAEKEAREKAAREAREKEARDKAAAAASARASQQKNENDLESFFGMGSRASSAPRPRASASDPLFDSQFPKKQSESVRTSSGSAANMRKTSSSANIVDDLSSIFGGAPSAGAFQDVEGETEERRRSRLERHQRTQERAAKALAEKNQRDLDAQNEQAERHRIAETLDVEIKRWAAGKEGNLRALLSTLQYVLWPGCGWQPVSLTDLITAAAVKKVYRKATLCIHPDKVQQKGATLQQKYVAEKVFDLLKEAWNKFNSEELF